MKFGWSLDERLVVLNEEGVYRLYDLQGEYQQHSLGTEAAEMGIIDAKIYGNGMVALTSSLTLLEVKGWEGARPLTLANPGTFAAPPFWTLVNVPSRFERAPTCMVHYTSGPEYLASRRSAPLN